MDEMDFEDDYRTAPTLWEEGFLDPEEMTAIPEYGDGLMAGHELECLMMCGYSTNQVYLASVNEFPGKVDQFINKMTEFYYDRVGDPDIEMEVTLTEEDEIKVGWTVAVYVEKEWKRARVEEIVVPLEAEPEPVYKVTLLDLGEVHQVTKDKMFYLHQDFELQPCWAIRARLPKMDEFYGKYECVVGDLDRRTWDKAVMPKVLEMVFDKPFVVKFLKKVKLKVEMLWEVELLRFKSQNQDDALVVGSLEKRAIENTFPEMSFWQNQKDAENAEVDRVDDPELEPSVKACVSELDKLEEEDDDQVN